MCALWCNAKNIFTFVRCVGQDCAMTYAGMRWDSERWRMFGGGWSLAGVDEDLRHVMDGVSFPWGQTRRALSWSDAVDDDVLFNSMLHMEDTDGTTASDPSRHWVDHDV